MSTLHGYHGRCLKVDLSSRSSVDIIIPNDVLRDFIGGSGLGTWLLLEHCPDGVDPLAPESPLIFVFSPLVGSPLTTSAKFAVLSKSPLTQRINDSLSSSGFAIAGKKCGYDAIVIVGAAQSPTCIVVEDSLIRFETADDVWGSSSRDAERVLGTRLGKGFRIAAIGPAGEKLVRYATVSHDGRHAGRGGLGAVMGSKQLKALAVRGTQQTPFAFPEELVNFSRELSKKSFGPATEKYRELGTVSNLLTFNRLGTLPTRNFQTGTFAEAELLSPEIMSQNHERTRASCAACTIGCEHIFHTIRQADSEDSVGVRMEYENLFALGPLCGVSDSNVVLEASRLCDELGLDTISAGGSIAFAMECVEHGLLDEPELKFGNGPALLATLRKIGAREGVGDLLAEGTRIASQRIGQGSEAFAAHVKGLELPGYEPRVLQTMALGFAVGSRGADHNRSGAYQVDFSDQVDRLNIDESAVPLAIETEDEAALMDSLILCKFLRGVFDDRFAAMGEMLRLVTGVEYSVEELRNTARRIVHAKKLFNIRQGWTPEEDCLPDRFMNDPLSNETTGPAVLSRSKLASLIAAYNQARGWTAEGWMSDSQP
ncbi:MAG: aldehyde ferredoxin oxidoreductase family protein [Rhodopirellula sp.]|nr:aldehyde ferredoxin oxidoreductase family protein [Rhodopirellula sp.]